jgi:hypothetical protein
VPAVRLLLVAVFVHETFRQYPNVTSQNTTDVARQLPDTFVEIVFFIMEHVQYNVMCMQLKIRPYCTRICHYFIAVLQDECML